MESRRNELAGWGCIPFTYIGYTAQQTMEMGEKGIKCVQLQPLERRNKRGKIPDQHYKVSLFSNPGDKVLKR